MNHNFGVKKSVVLELKNSFFVGLFVLSLSLIIILFTLQPLCLWAQMTSLKNTGSPAENLSVSLLPGSPLQGQAVIVSIRCRQASPVPQQLLLLGKKYKIVAVGEKEYKAACAVPLNASPGSRQLRIVLTDDTTVKIPLTVRQGKYGEEHLHLPAEMANPLNAVHLRQIKNDRIRLRQAYGSSKAVIRFYQPFVRPLKSTIITPFGRRRFLNGIPKSPHGGIDLRGKIGTPVPAAGGGKVAFSGKLYYSGNAVIIDHGLDIFSLYLHLDKILVAKGDRIKQGQIIGRLGRTGRVTGPHLHWGIKLNGIFVDPLEFIKVSWLLLSPAGEELNGQTEF